MLVDAMREITHSLRRSSGYVPNRLHRADSHIAEMVAFGSDARDSP